MYGRPTFLVVGWSLVPLGSPGLPGTSLGKSGGLVPEVGLSRDVASMPCRGLGMCSAFKGHFVTVSHRFNGIGRGKELEDNVMHVMGTILSTATHFANRDDPSDHDENPQPTMAPIPGTVLRLGNHHLSLVPQHNA